MAFENYTDWECTSLSKSKVKSCYVKTLDTEKRLSAHRGSKSAKIKL